MSLPPAVEAALGEALGAEPVSARPVGGGSINRAARVALDDGREVFVKHHPEAPPGAFALEADGLRWLGVPGAPRVPEVLAVGDAPGARFLALEWIADGGGGGATAGEEMGRSLAALHRAGAPSFGWERDNVIGPLPQANDPLPDWAGFHAERRLLPMARAAADAGGLTPAGAARVEAVAARLPDLGGPPEPPARLHGDLWGGNAMLGAEGGPVVIDPAVYGGHREMDLAMMRLFGGFPASAFAAYEEEHPLAPGHEDRVELCQLYPLLVHAVLFGASYGASAERVARRYAG
ncbi:MAG: fructosamine kinase family protein [Thermoleophilia bacterium]